MLLDEHTRRRAETVMRANDIHAGVLYELQYNHADKLHEIAPLYTRSGDTKLTLLDGRLIAYNPDNGIYYPVHLVRGDVPPLFCSPPGVTSEKLENAS